MKGCIKGQQPFPPSCSTPTELVGSEGQHPLSCSDITVLTVLLRNFGEAVVSLQHTIHQTLLWGAQGDIKEKNGGLSTGFYILMKNGLQKGD